MEMLLMGVGVRIKFHVQIRGRNIRRVTCPCPENNNRLVVSRIGFPRSNKFCPTCGRRDASSNSKSLQARKHDFFKVNSDMPILKLHPLLSSAHWLKIRVDKVHLRTRSNHLTTERPSYERLSDFRVVGQFAKASDP